MRKHIGLLQYHNMISGGTRVANCCGQGRESRSSMSNSSVLQQALKRDLMKIGGAPCVWHKGGGDWITAKASRGSSLLRSSLQLLLTSIPAIDTIVVHDYHHYRQLVPAIETSFSPTCLPLRERIITHLAGNSNFTIQLRRQGYKSHPIPTKLRPGCTCEMQAPNTRHLPQRAASKPLKSLADLQSSSSKPPTWQWFPPPCRRSRTPSRPLLPPPACPAARQPPRWRIPAPPPSCPGSEQNACNPQILPESIPAYS